MERKNELVNIRVENLYPHPDNPRKQLGDISELADSIGKNGVMQNLTVIPISALDEEPEKQVKTEDISLKSDFCVLIGHRRLAAAKEAGISEVPCRIISQISKKEQVGIMLEENMQRNDLTIYEQAQGFQMMLDLGETPDTIAEKTGFSKATIYHRLNIAKLDQKELQKKEKSDSFQLSLKDLYELEKIEDIKTRNKILKEATDSNNLVFRAQQAVKEEKRKKFIKKLIPMLKEQGISPAPKSAENEQWSNKWERLKEYDTEGKLPEKIKVQAKKNDKLFYVRWWNRIYIIRKATKTDKKETSAEKARKEDERKKKELKALAKQLLKRTKEFVICIVNGSIKPAKETEELRKMILDAALLNGSSMYKSSLVKFIAGKSAYDCTDEEKANAELIITKLSSLQILLILMAIAIEDTTEFYDYFRKCNKKKTENLMKVYNILEQYGWSFEAEELQLLDGSHELYVKEAK